MITLFDPTSGLLARTLDTTLARQAVLTSNIANLDTPGFTPRDIDFDRAIGHALERAERGQQALRRSPSELRPAELRPYERPDRAPRGDGNTVDLDAQMARVSQNALLYDASTTVLTRRMQLMKYVVTEGGM